MTLLTLWVALTGCHHRQILQIQDGPPSAKQTTVLTTTEVKSYVLFGITKRVYWECENTGSGLVCTQTCDVKDDEGDFLACPTSYGGV